MKSLIFSSLAVGLTMAQSWPNYYIGPYMVNGVVTSLVAYPTGQCVSTGVGSSTGYSVFVCTGNSNNYIIQETYSASDSMCEGAHTNTTAPTSNKAGMTGYFYCGGEEDYMLIDQYLGSCASWTDGSDSALVATTTLTSGACVYAGPAGGGHSLYSLQTCDGDGQHLLVFRDDPTCTNMSLGVEEMDTPLGCSYYTTESKTKIYSAMRECVINDVEQRCTSPLVSFATTIKFVGLEEEQDDWWEVFEDLFPYSTISVWDQATMVNDSIIDTVWLNLSFCTPHEDGWYSSWLQDFGTTLWGVAPSEAICWTCDWWYCANSTLCGSDSYCDPKTQCLNATTTSTSTTTKQASTTTTAKSNNKKSAVGNYISLLTLIALVVVSLSF